MGFPYRLLVRRVVLIGSVGRGSRFTVSDRCCCCKEKIASQHRRLDVSFFPPVGGSVFLFLCRFGDLDVAHIAGSSTSPEPGKLP